MDNNEEKDHAFELLIVLFISMIISYIVYKFI